MPSNGEWFRCYCDIYRNRKLRNVTETLQLRYMWFLALHKEGKLVGASIEDISWELRIPADDVQQSIDAMIAAGLLLSDRTPKGWDERQFISDSSRDRVQRHRNMKRYCNVTVTPSESDTESDTDKIPPNRPPQGGAPEPPEFLQAWSEYPRRSGGNPRKPGLSAWKARVREGRTTPADALEAVRRYRAWCEATGKIGTETVMQFASFFGPQKEGYLQDWAQPAAESGAVNSEEAEVERRHLADKKRAIRMMVLDGDVAAAMAEIEHAKTAWRQGLKKYLAELQAIPSLELARASLGDGGGFPAV